MSWKTGILIIVIFTAIATGVVFGLPEIPQTEWEVESSQTIPAVTSTTATTTETAAATSSAPELERDEREEGEKEALAGLQEIPRLLVEGQGKRSPAATSQKTAASLSAAEAGTQLIDATKPPPGAQAPSPILAMYPFTNKNVTLAEGFSAYDGVLGDEPGARHRGIDYVLKEGGSYKKFDTFAMRGGEAWQGTSDTWGLFVIVRHPVSSTLNYYTIYGHLENVPTHIPRISKNPAVKVPGLAVSVGTFLGKAGVSGNAQSHVPQLHIELHEENIAQGTWLKLDPYNIYGRASSGRYPHPGESLANLNHWWTSDTPPLAN